MASYAGGRGNDKWTGSKDGDTADGNEGNDQLNGAGGGDRLQGGAGADILDGGDGDDFLASFQADDKFVAQPYDRSLSRDIYAETDRLLGGAGDDYLAAGYSDEVDGGTGYNRLYLNLLGAEAGVTADFSVLTDGGSVRIGGGTIKNIAETSTVIASNFDDRITTAGVVGAIYGEDGNDRIDVRADEDTRLVDGGAGNDVIYGGFDLAILDGGTGDDTIVGGTSGYGAIIIGGEGNDTLSGTAPMNGGAGDDEITLGSRGGAGDGGDGDDRISASGGSTQMLGGSGADTLIGGDGDDYIESAGFFDAFNTIVGEEDRGREHDRLSGGAGNDTLYAGYGDDVDGGTGDNYLTLSLGGASKGVTLDTSDLLSGSYKLGGGTIANISQVQTVFGSDHGDTLVLGSQSVAGTLFGRGGDDRLEAASDGSVLHGDEGDDTLIGGRGTDELYGGSGADTLNGGAGDDILHVEANDDLSSSSRYVGGTGEDRVRIDYGVTAIDLTQAKIEGVEQIEFYARDVAVKASVENLNQYVLTPFGGTLTIVDGGTVKFASGTVPYFNTIQLSDFGNVIDVSSSWASYHTINGGAGNDQIRGVYSDTLNGGGGDDVLQGDLGSSWLNGGEGTDTVVYAHATGAVELKIDSYGQFFGGNNGGYDLLTGIENATGSRFGDQLTGDDGANVLAGVEGDDQLTGGNGNDRLDGGAGHDTLYGNRGDDTYVVDSAHDKVIEYSRQGTDTVLSSVSWTLGDNVENLTLSGTKGNAGTGNKGDNTITGNSGDNLLTGGDGNDRLDGGAGHDTLYGNRGDDTYVVDSAHDTVTEYSRQGTDTVMSSVTWTLGRNFENLTLTGSKGNGGTGNEAANAITGNGGANTLLGLAGNDTIAGGSGDDTIAGGAGQDLVSGGDGRDMFVFAGGDFAGLRPNSCDRIGDFLSGTDRIDLHSVDAVTGGTDQAFRFIGTAAFDGTAGELRYSVSHGNATVEADTNGDGASDLRIALDHVAALNATDFVL